jgi:hypothetical protein
MMHAVDREISRFPRKERLHTHPLLLAGLPVVRKSFPVCPRKQTSDLCVNAVHTLISTSS